MSFLFKGDSLPRFPRSAVQLSTEERLTSVFEMGTGGTTPLWPSKSKLLLPIYKDYDYFSTIV